MMKPIRSVVLIYVAALFSSLLTGCSEKTEMTKQEEQSFKSTGKMPPEAAAAIAKQRAEAEAKLKASGAPVESIPGGAK